MGYKINTDEIVIDTEKDFEECLNQAAQLQLNIEAEIAAYNEAKAAADKAFKNRMNLKAKRVALAYKACEIYADENKEQLLGDKKSAETRVAEYGFRTSPGEVKTINRKWTFKKSLDALIEADQTNCILVKKELDKEGVKKNLSDEKMKEFGLKVVKPEIFWVEPKKELKG